MRAVVLERTHEISIRDIAIEETLGEQDVRIRIDTVGICGSDVHYYTHGRIGDFVVKEPMVLGHEASGIIEEIGSSVTELAVGDRVCMEPGIPDPTSRESLSGHYNIDPSVRFWATPPIHGCLREQVIHPARFTFKLPDSVSMGQGALVEPLAIGIHAATTARIAPGDTALVIGAGTIGIMTALACTVSGCSKVIIADISSTRLDFVKQNYAGILTVNSSEEDLIEALSRNGCENGCTVVFEATGSPTVSKAMSSYASPGGTIVAIGMPPDGILPVDIVTAQSKELTIKTIFRYVNMYPRALALLGSGRLDLTPCISRRYSFEESVRAFEEVATSQGDVIKAVIEMH